MNGTLDVIIYENENEWRCLGKVVFSEPFEQCT